jgi:osmoprotectant transport system permease protein
MSWKVVLDHLFMVFVAVVLSLAAGLPLGVATYLHPRTRRAILWVVDLFQTIPSLALLGIIMVFLGAGKQTVILGLTLYSLLPIVRNTYLGLSEVDPGLKEAARGMGMSKRYQLFHVELPLASPMIFTGIRIATVNAVGTAVFAVFVGGGGLGAPLYNGIRIQNMSLIMQGTAVLMIMAVAFDFAMGRIERILSRKANGQARVPPRMR